MTAGIRASRSSIETEPLVRFVPFMELWDGFERRVADMVEATGAVDIGELGGGANPTVSLVERVSRPIELTVLDISGEELAKSPAGVKRICADLCAEEPPVTERFDLVFSRMLCEHARSGRLFHRNCRAALRSGGYAVHFFPTITAFPFLVNRALPEALGQRVVEAILPSRQRGGRHSKFPAYYHWCWGPTRQQLARYRSVGFDVVSYDVGIGHNYYRQIPGVRSLERAKSRYLLRHPSPWLAAYALVVLRAGP
jgi:SAM-dependent methyltransferase